MKRKKRWVVPIVAGCLVMYAAFMLLAVWLMKEKYSEDFKEHMGIFISNLQKEIGEKAQEEAQNGNYTDEMLRNYYQYMANNVFGGGRYQQFSVGIYGADQKLIARTEDSAYTSYASAESNWQTTYINYSLNDLADEEIKTLIGYLEKSRGSDTAPGDYGVLARVSEDDRELYGILVQKLIWEETEDGICSYTNPLTGSSWGYQMGDGSRYVLAGSEIVWEWERPGVNSEDMESSVVNGVSFCLPYMDMGYGDWEKWKENSYLQEFPEEMELSAQGSSNVFLEEYAEFYSDSHSLEKEERLRMAVLYPSGNFVNQTSESPAPVCYLEVRAVNEPWLAALDYMKYVLLAGFGMMLLCMGIIIYVTDQTYKRRAALEETRRDFINAMAHELKTPLGIIRGFAENLLEHVMEEKRDYYTRQIIGQTEEMDGLVAKMIEVSRLDSDNLVLQKDQVSMNALLKEQIERLSVGIGEKNLTVQYEEKAECIVKGDREYLEKAVWNLLSNAVVYNVPDGTLRIITEADQCRIENTASPMTEEQLTHAFDLFYSSDRSRSFGEKHMGLGLFLTRRILELHKISISIGNTADGVFVVLKKK